MKCYLFSCFPCFSSYFVITSSLCFLNLSFLGSRLHQKLQTFKRVVGVAKVLGSIGSIWNTIKFTIFFFRKTGNNDVVNLLMQSFLIISTVVCLVNFYGLIFLGECIFRCTVIAKLLSCYNFTNMRGIGNRNRAWLKGF